ncbi:MAG: glycosyltransferase [Cyanobacteria bacterium]|nr:glycosyltransferase [Cyanobacteriota bacterium]MDA0865077.1 glycosyltransferase [Cyanobacteriota bacterium]
MDLPLVSVVIPTHNRLDLLEEAVESIQGQTYKNWELIIVDDMSNDGTWAWLTELNDNRIRVFRLSEQSFREGACNKGLEEAAGKFIMFFDDDDILRADALENLVRPLSLDSTLAASVGARWKFKKGAYALRIEHPILPFRKVIWPELLAGWSPVSGQNLYRTSFVREIGGFSRDFYRVEDRDFWLRISRKGPVMLLPRITVNYRVHSGQWRPKNIIELRVKVFKAFIDSLPSDIQARGIKIRKSADYLKSAEEEHGKRRYGKALAYYCKACCAAPELMISPLIGPIILRGIGKSILRTLVKGQ